METIMETGQLNLNTSWGPFSATYLGLSHTLDATQGTMADVALWVGRIAPASVVLPDNIFGYVPNQDGDRRATVRAVPEDVLPDYSAFSIRYFLDRQGDTAVARFTVESDERARCDIIFHNTSGKAREYRYGLGLMVADARRRIKLKAFLRPWWIPARQYTSIEAYQKAFDMGCGQCLTRFFSWGVEDAVLAQAFGGWSGDRVTYRAPLPGALRNGFIYFRYVKYGDLDHPWEIRINGQPTTFRFPQTWAMPGGGWGKECDAYEEWRLLRIPIGAVPAGETTVELRPLNPPGNDQARIWLDGMLFNEGLLAGDDGAGDLLPTTLIDAPTGETARVDLESTAGSNITFQIRVPDDVRRSATIASYAVTIQALDGSGSFLGSLRRRFGLPSVPLERDSTVCPWGAMDSGPITVPARSERRVSFTIAFRPEPSGASANVRTHNPVLVPPSPRGPFANMVASLRDAVLFNVNYPLTLFGRPSPYYVPAKYFPSPYSWDGGFAAVGLATFAPELARQQTAFFMADEDHDFPCLYSGSPVPTPLYAMWDIYQAIQDPAFLSGIYAGAKRMYDFYLGRTPGSVVNAHGDGMLSTYPYNYNLGIDDHPIQRWAEERHLTRNGLYSIILMPQILRIARLMRNIARLLEHDADAGQYRRDADQLADIIDHRMWDEPSGLYGWLYRTDRGVEPVAMDGCAGDRSACAFLPLFAGQTAHKARLVEQMTDPSRFKTPYGISSVDMSAPSYNPHGYWNGAVWPVMQWYLWRGLLEADETILARQVAETILGTWQRCFAEDHYLGEHFVIAKAQMSGAPNFGGLSAVLLPMHATYFTPYQVTARYDVIILRQSVDRARDTLSLTLTAPFLVLASHDLLVNMGRAKTRYTLIVNGQPYGSTVSDEYGHLVLRLPRSAKQDEVRVQPALLDAGSAR